MQLDNNITALNGRFPGRNYEIEQLVEFVGTPDDPSPPCLFVYGHKANGKTAVVRALFQEHYPTELSAYVSCIECYTPRLVFESILSQFTGSEPSVETGFRSAFKCDNMQDFVYQLRTRVYLSTCSSRLNTVIPQTRYIVFDNAEKLRDMSPTLLSAFIRLGELGQLPVSVILVSCLVWDKFRPRNGAPEPLLLRFPIYTKQNVLDILALECPPDEELWFFTGFVSVAYDVFHRNCKDINELRYLVTLLFPKFREPVIQGLLRRTDSSKLFRISQPYFTAATDKLYLREISSLQWRKHLHTDETNTSDQESTDLPSLLTSSQTPSLPLVSKLDFELPYYTKFLLLASFLASYNPPRLDIRYFSKSKESGLTSKRSKNAAQKQMLESTGGKRRQQLLGPKAFPMERMLAIFYSIIDDPIENTVEIQSQIASLVTLRLLVRASHSNQLDSIKYKSNVSYDLVRRVGRSVQFDVERYLYDFM
ncbi:hypothetical protein IWQ61_006819 [Dispira simplex]|nr:hypothetical protein IWQ61_006819 [Dispira simplex]